MNTGTIIKQPTNNGTVVNGNFCGMNIINCNKCAGR